MLFLVIIFLMYSKMMDQHKFAQFYYLHMLTMFPSSNALLIADQSVINKLLQAYIFLKKFVLH